MSVNYTGGLNFSMPSKGDTNYDTTIDGASVAISGHDHTGAGKGTQIATGAIAANAVTDVEIRLTNLGSLRGRNHANNGDVNIARIDASNWVEFPTKSRFSSTETITSAGTITLSPNTLMSIANKGSGALALGDGVEGQFKVLVNINAFTIVCTPVTTAGTNTASLVQYGSVMYWYLGAEWRAFAGAGCTLS